MRTKINRFVSLLLLAVMTLSLLGQPVLAAAEQEYLIKLTDNISLANNVASQTGTLTYNAWNNAATFSGTKQTENSTYDQLKLVQTGTINWKNPFTFNASQFSQAKKTVIDIKFKVTLDDYNTSASPRIGIRLFQSGLIQREALAQKNGVNAYTPTESTKNDWNIVRFVIDPTTQKTYSSFNGSDYAGSDFHNSTEGNTGNYSGDFRLYLTAITGADGYDDEASTPLETPVTWYIDEFTAYETDGEIPPAPEKPESDPEIAANISYIVKLDDSMNHNTTNFSTTQDGTLYFTKIGGTTISGYGSVGSNWDQIKLTETVMSDWKNNFYINGSDVSTSRKTVVDMKFKVNLDDYTKETLPKVGIRFYHNKGIFHIDGMSNVVPAEADKDAWQTVRFVINNEDKKVYASLNGGAYISRAYSVSAETFGDDNGQIRIYPVALPGGETQVDGETALETPVNWYIDSFKAYQMDGEMPSPAEDPTTEGTKSDAAALLRLIDNMKYNSSTFVTTQIGYDLAMNFVKIDNTELAGEEANGTFYKQLKLTQNVMSSWKNTFWFDGALIPTDKKTVIDIKFKVNLGDYSVADKPKVGWRLYNSDGSFYLDGMSNVVPDEADKDKWQTMRFVLNNEDKTAYASLNGNAYKSNKFLADITGSAYGGQVRIYPVALPGGEEQNDGSTTLETPVTWYIDSVVVYQTSQAMPSASDLSDPTEPKTDELPDAIPEPTEVPIPAEIAGKVVRSYPDGKMKAVIMSFDDGANWCEASDRKAIEILNERGAVATFNLVPGNCHGTFLANAAEMYKGHEIASHGYLHQHLDEIDDTAFMQEIQLSKEMLEEAIGTEVPGFAYPYGWKSDSKRLRMMQDLGYRYTRAAVSTGKFDVPDTFYDWDPTSWLSVKQYWDLTQSQMKNFKEMDASSKWQLMFTSGHAWQFEADAEGNGGESYWYALEEFVDYIAENKAEMWNPTTAEFADYVRASRQMSAVQGADGTITLTNPEKIDVWALVDGSAVKVPAEQSVTVGVVAEDDFVAKEYLLDVDTNITQFNSTVSSNGELTYTGEVRASEDNESFYVKQDTKSAWSKYITVTSPAMSSVKLDEPLVIEAKYNIRLDSYEGTAPNVQMTLQAQDLNIWANSGVGTELAAPTADSADSWNIIKFVIDAKTQKVYYSINGGAYTTVAADRLANISQLGNGVRLYLRSYPSTSPDDSGDTKTALDTPVTWTFDYVKMYKLGADEAVKISSASAVKSGNTVSCDISVRNYDTVASDCTLIAALYDGEQLVDTAISELSPAAFAKQTVNAALDATSVAEPVVKAFLWNSTSGLVPYEAELVSVK